MSIAQKRKDEARAPQEEAAGREHQEAIRQLLAGMADNGRYMDRGAFEADLMDAARAAEVKLLKPTREAIFAALGERDPEAEICRDSKGNPEPDSQLRDNENIPLPADFDWPDDFERKPDLALPMDHGPDKPNGALIEAMQPAIDEYVQREVLPHVPDAWVDYSKTKVGYEIPINRHFYVYKPPRPLADIESDIEQLEGEIAELLEGLVS